MQAKLHSIISWFSSQVITYISTQDGSLQITSSLDLSQKAEKRLQITSLKKFCVGIS